MERHLDQWPFPDRESLAAGLRRIHAARRAAVLSMERFTTMQTSRGCPWPCVFCDIPIFNEGSGARGAPQHVVDEFKHLQEQGYGCVYFVDDHFLLQPKRIEAICNGIKRRASRFNGAARGASIPSPSICFRRWRKPTAALSCSVSRVEAKSAGSVEERANAGRNRNRGD